MQLQELFDYKNRLMHDILTNEEVVSLIDPSVQDVNQAYDRLAYKRVFPYNYVPETIEDAGTYICFEVDVQKVINKTFLRPTISIWIFTHKSQIRLAEGGVRTDVLCSKIAEAINGSRYYGLGELELNSVRRYAPMADYQGKLMTFEAQDFNNPSPSKQSIPSNRKQW